MRQLPCPHCNEEIPDVGDAFCPYCHEELCPEHNPYESDEGVDSIQVEPMPTSFIVVALGESNWPGICLLCATPTQQSRRLRFQLNKTVQKSLLKSLFGWNPFAGLFVDEAFDERPIDFHLPVCESHLHDERLACVRGTAVEGRQVRIVGVHPEFASAVQQLHQSRWDAIAKRYDDS